MVEDAVDIGLHILLSEVLDQLHVAIPDCVHERVPVVGSGELVYKMREGVEEVDHLFAVMGFSY